MTVYRIRLLALITLGLSFLACSSVDLGGNDGGQNAPTTFKGQLTGEWNGHMINKTVSEGSNLRESNVKAEFEFKNDSEGTFAFTLPSIENATASGTFADFAGKSLHLTIAKSSISTLGASETSTSVNYTIIGKSMELSNDRLSLQLIKGPKSVANDGSQGSATIGDDLVGSWECKDGNDKTWNIVTKSRTEFFAEVFGNSAAPAIWIGGGMTVTTDEESPKGNASVINSSNSNYIGMRFIFIFKSAVSIVVERLKSVDDSDETVEDTFECSRKK